MVTALGVINLYLTEYDTALNLLEIAIGLDSENLMAYYFLGQCYEEVGVSELSMEYYDKILLQNIPYESDFFSLYYISVKNESSKILRRAMKFRVLLPFGTFWDVNALEPKYFEMIKHIAYSFDVYKSWEELRENIDYNGEMAILIINNNDSILFDEWENIDLDEIFDVELKSESKKTSEKL